MRGAPRADHTKDNPMFEQLNDILEDLRDRVEVAQERL
jgi:hypothetical protein